MSQEPQKVTLRSYHVGFGDCFLLSFFYGDREPARHVLIDFGSTKTPQNKSDALLKAAENIQDRIAKTNGELTAVVATHRHKDHIDGFRTKTKDENPDQPGDIIRACSPKLVMQPWTEDPGIDTDATAPHADPNLDRKGFRSALSDLAALSGAIAHESVLYADAVIAGQLHFLGENNLGNRSAVENLMSMGKAAKAEYVYAGFSTQLSGALLPGVEVSVLGPPTLEQSSQIRKQRSKDEEEFWHLWRHTLSAVKLGFTNGGAITENSKLAPVFPCASYYSPSENPPQARWFRRKMQEMRGRELLELVRTLDKVLNNTSVILLFEFGGKKLLFPGDAQIENWSYALDDEKICKKLREVDLYKVGHHGSLNATPKSLWDLFDRKRAQNGSSAVMKTVVSTLAGKHGHPEDGTEVPRTKLVEQLEESSDYYSTQFMEPTDEYFHDIEIL